MTSVSISIVRSVIFVGLVLALILVVLPFALRAAAPIGIAA